MAHESGVTGAGVKVAVIDSGIDYTHPDLAANYAGGWDFYANDADPMDDCGHGKHVAGTVAAQRDAVGVVGAAPGVTLYALSAWPKRQQMQWAVERDPRRDRLGSAEWHPDYEQQLRQRRTERDG